MAGARRRLRYPVRVSGPNGPVTVRFMTPSRPGWSLEEAVDLVRQGYTVEHASRVSGWASGLIEARIGKRPQVSELGGSAGLGLLSDRSGGQELPIPAHRSAGPLGTPASRSGRE